MMRLAEKDCAVIIIHSECGADEELGTRQSK